MPLSDKMFLVCGGVQIGTTVHGQIIWVNCGDNTHVLVAFAVIVFSILKAPALEILFRFLSQ